MTIRIKYESIIQIKKVPDPVVRHFNCRIFSIITIVMETDVIFIYKENNHPLRVHF